MLMGMNTEKALVLNVPIGKENLWFIGLEYIHVQ